MQNDHGFPVAFGRPRFALSATCLGVLLMAFVSTSAWASSVRAVDVGEMLEHAELVFEGQVIAERVKRGDRKRDIYTEVTFQVTDVIKGEFDADAIVLSFSGGAIDGEAVVVSDLNRPRVGDRGVYFVESMQRRQVHPLYGWDQGLFVVEPDLASGASVVKTQSRKAIYGVSSSQAASDADSGLSNGVAIGLRLQRRSADERPMTLDQFKDTLRGLSSGVAR